jgi:hypothetical protein
LGLEQGEQYPHRYDQGAGGEDAEHQSSLT